MLPNLKKKSDDACSIKQMSNNKQVLQSKVKKHIIPDLQNKVRAMHALRSKKH